MEDLLTKDFISDRIGVMKSLADKKKVKARHISTYS